MIADYLPLLLVDTASAAAAALLVGMAFLLDDAGGDKNSVVVDADVRTDFDSAVRDTVVGGHAAVGTEVVVAD